MKEKSVMEDKIFDFAKTKDALGELSAGLIELDSILKIKQNQIAAEKQKYAEDAALKEQKITALSKAAEDAMTKIENINKYIEEML